MQQGSATRTSPASVSAALAAVNAGLRAADASPPGFPGEDGGQSLAEMAEHDLDAALHLLADRAQYITGASGAAIALRRSGHNDMLCRASTGSNAPELGALFSTEFGLSGESVRTRLPLRCDDAERDPRVNREGCRHLGIASVVVMPVVHDDEVLGVFELFSGKPNAFEERDLSALQRLSQMVETAVRVAHAAEILPERSRANAPAAGVEIPEAADGQRPVLDVETEVVAEVTSLQLPPGVEPAQAGAVLPRVVPQVVPEVVPQSTAPMPEPAPPKRPLWWSATLSTSAGAQPPAEPDQSHLPPVLRNLHKCQACGFPVSEGRVLCVECEEKKWRGQLRVPKSVVLPQPKKNSSATVISESGSRTSLAAASKPVLSESTSGPVPASTAKKALAGSSSSASIQEASAGARTSSALPILSAGLSPSESWLSANKYVVGAILVVAAVIAAIVFLR